MIAGSDHDPGSRAPFAPWQRLALLAGFLLLVILRLPHAWKQGRFQDEEATVFLAYAWHHNWWEALFRPFGGYWNLAANGTTLIVVHLVKAGVIALEHAPYVTMMMALAVQALPAILLLTGRAGWLERRTTVVLALLILAMAPGIEEVFVNVLHIQFHLALCAASILALDRPRRTAARIGYALLLFLAPLCGPVAMVFAPLFALRIVVDRDWRRIEQIAALASGGAIQMLFFYGANPMRGHMLNPDTTLAAMVVRLIAMPALGFGKAGRIGDAVFQSKLAGGFGWWWADVAGLVFFGALLVAAARRRDGAIWLLVASLAIGFVTFGFGMIMAERYAPFELGSGRYTFLPLILLSFTLIALAMRPGSKLRYACGLLLLLTCITGASRYRRPMAHLRNGPSWPNEVAAWKADHSHKLAVWPGRWRADLSDDPHVCAPIGPHPERSKEPRYCESGWAASFYRRRKALADPKIDEWR
jgi:hypothetical protein